VVCRSHLATGFLFTASMRVLNHQALRPITIHRHPWVYSARPTKCGLALYTVTVDVNRVYDSKARRYAEDNRTESNCTTNYNDRHGASRGLFATAELLVFKNFNTNYSSPYYTVQNITEKFKSLCSVQQRFEQLTTDDRHRQTDVLCHTANVTK